MMTLIQWISVTGLILYLLAVSYVLFLLHLTAPDEDKRVLYILGIGHILAFMVGHTGALCVDVNADTGSSLRTAAVVKTPLHVD